MRILHVPYTFYPDPAGGTEIYVHSLATAQRARGLDVAIAAPTPSPSRYDHDQLPVWRFPVSKNLSLTELYGDGAPLLPQRLPASSMNTSPMSSTSMPSPAPFPCSS